MGDIQLVSADSHVNPPPTMWADFLPAEYRHRAPVVEETEEGQFQVFEGQRTPMLGISAMAGKRPEDYSWNVRRLDDVRPGGWDPDARLVDQDIDGVSAEVLYGGGPLRCDDPGLARASYSAYNDWLSDFCSTDSSRLIGMAYLPATDPDDTVAEIRRLAGRQTLRGAVIGRFPDHGEWYEPRWDPLWQTLIDVGWPAAIHVGGRGRAAPMPRTDGIGYIVDLLMSKFAMGEAVTTLAVSGVLRRFPELRVICVEGQIGWISFAHYYLDHLWAKHRFWTGNDLPEPPSVYMKQQVWSTFMEDPVGLRERHHIGVDKIMWSSDYPHSETTWPHSRKLTDEWFTDISATDRRLILADNCNQLFGL